MKADLRVSLAAVALALGSGAPAFAQDAPETVTSTSAAPAPADTVGPAQLRDFSLSGTVTKPAEPSGTPVRIAPPPPQSSSAAASAPASTTTAAPTRERAASAAPAPAQRNAPAPATAAANNPFSFPAPTPSTATVPGFAAAPLAAQPASSPAVDPIAAPSTETPHSAALWPWLLALVAAIGAAFWYFRRQRSGGYAFAGAGADASAFDRGPEPSPPVRPAAPRPTPAAQPRAAAPAPAPTKPVGVPAPAATPPVVSKGIVSTRLRPWIDMEFVPDRVEIAADHATVHFGIEVFNSGSAPARDLLIEAVLFNAGGDQDEAINRFFAKEAMEGERIPVISPLQRMAFQSAVTISREQMRIFEAGGRKVWVPLIGFNAFYRWGGGEGQTSASYLLGRDSAGDKMSPFRTDIGPRTFRGLGFREHTLKVRK